MIEFFFDCSSPWTYLAFHNLQPMARALGVEVRWRPILVGGIFNSVNPSVYEFRTRGVPAKQLYQLKDLQDWAHGRDISQDEVLADLCTRVGVEPQWLFEGIARPGIKALLKANTDEVIARGGFGSPTMFVGGDDMYFGNDRLELVRDAVLRRQAASVN